MKKELEKLQTEKTTFSCKDDYCKALYIYWSGGQARDLYIDKAHTALDIFRLAAFFTSVLMFS